MRQSVCPYCFESLSRDIVAFQCINPNPVRCPPEPDEKLKEYMRLNIAPAKPKVMSLKATRFSVPGSATCACGVKTTKAVCVHCHNELPSEFTSSDSFTVALIGAKDSGKSHYIAVLINELKTRVGARLNASLNAMDEQTIKRYKEDFERHVYDLQETIPTTRTGRQDISVRYPLIYRMSVERRRLGLKKVLVSSMVFFDTAGEDLDDIDKMSTEARYIASCDGMIFLLDPLQIPKVRGRLNGRMALPEIHTDPEDIIGRVMRLRRQIRGLGSKQRIDAPVALAFSKIDAVRSLVEPGSSIHRASRHNGYFDLTDAEELSESMRGYVASWVGPGLDTLLQHNFDKFRYFGVSSLGSPPENTRLTMAVAPFRVEDPLLWILYELGVIPGQRRQS